MFVWVIVTLIDIVISLMVMKLCNDLNPTSLWGFQSCLLPSVPGQGLQARLAHPFFLEGGTIVL